jgi:geranylgeranyl reductase family protein
VSNKYDVAVVGAGPSGSTAAYHLAKSGARVLLLDKAKYPRVKPCGGGVTARCFEQAPVDLTPVVERVIDRVRFSFRLGNFMDYRYPKTLVYMTQRDRLDAFLADNAAAAGATFMDATPLRELTLSKDGARIATARDVFEADVVVGADGANGIVARAAGLQPVVEPPVALEANFPYRSESEKEAWSDVLALELGSMDGGYGWDFPKSDHHNVGCGGWKDAGGKLRDHLAALRHHYGLDANAMINLRGHHLPTRTHGRPITTGRVLLVGDAAGLVDPMSGEGIYAAFVSGRLAATAVRRFLDNKEPDLYPYEAAVERELMGEIRAAGVLRDAYHFTPRPCYWALQRSEALRRSMCQLITGEKTYDGFLQQLGPLSRVLSFWAARGRAARATA